jgi:hypothetical protein
MPLIDDLRHWYRWGHWLDTPQGLCVLLSFPGCLLGLAASLLWPGATRPTFLSADPALFLATPVLAFLCFLRLSGPSFRSSWTATLILLAIVATPFVAPCLRPA